MLPELPAEHVGLRFLSRVNSGGDATHLAADPDPDPDLFG
jgi:hypothetical protein